MGSTDIFTLGVFNWLSNFFTRKQRDEPDASKTPDSLDGDADEQASKSVRGKCFPPFHPQSRQIPLIQPHESRSRLY